ncbi:MAG: aspartate/glutamate racemase family protein [Deltaproteobacteria bacterium]|nr:aspartate/glutamate racemase family protein [Deltaproteobacteria bacterium]
MVDKVSVYPTVVGALPDISEYEARLRARAGASDQDFPVEVFKLEPPGACKRPLVLLGGMGPLAGTQAFRAALDRFGEDRLVVLVQQCNVPDRTVALLADAKEGQLSAIHHEVVARMADGLRLGWQHAGEGAALIVTCNTGHAFVAEAFAELEARGSGKPYQLFSLMESAAAELEKPEMRAKGEILILATDGTRRNRIYSDYFADRGIPYRDPGNEAQAVLMQGLYEGVKGCDEDRTLDRGTELMRVLGQDAHLELYLAGCTEVPELIDVLKQHGTAEIKSILQDVTVIDPVVLALDRVAAS